MMKLTLSLACGFVVVHLAHLSLAQQAGPPAPAQPNSATPNAPFTPQVSEGTVPAVAPGVNADSTSKPSTPNVAAPTSPTSDPSSSATSPTLVSPNPAPTATADSVPRTYEHRVSITLDLANVLWRTSRGYDLFSTNNVAWRIGVGVGYDFWRLPDRFVAAVEIGAMFEPEKDTNNDSKLLGGAISGTLSASTFLAGGSLRWGVLPWLAPYGRVQVLASRYNVDIRTSPTDANSTSVGADWSYHRWVGGGALGAGLMLNLPPATPVNAGLLFEGGYWLQHSVDLVLERSDAPSGSISIAGAKLGSLDNSGPYLRVAGLVRF